MYFESIYSPETLLSSGLRVSTPPSTRTIPRRLQLVPDENNPPSPPPLITSRFIRSRTPLEDQDCNSQDSGCAMSCSEDSQPFRFVEPSGFAPKRLNSLESPKRFLQFNSFSSENSNSNSNSCDDGCWDMSPLVESDEESTKFPLGFGSLISSNIISKVSPRKPLSGQISENRREELKRPSTEAAIDLSPLKQRLKRVKSYKEDNPPKKGTLFEYGFWKSAAPEPDQKTIKKISDSEINIKMALQRSTQEELIGDFSRPHALPLISGKHQDMKAISCDTLANLMENKYKDTIASFKIIDCRYPYEFEGGHIRGALNLYTCDHISQELLNSKKRRENDENGRRDILVFHCEFSSERGPFLSRFLRKEDRNGNQYPNLHYPELYLLDGGYSQFFKTHSDLCEPKSYRSMHDPNHASDFKHFRAKSKSWAPGHHKKMTMRSLTRLMY